jgi:hypothetical protein
VILRTLSQTDGLALLEARRIGQHVDFSAHETLEGRGEPADHMVDRAVTAVQNLRAQFPAELGRAEDRNRFDAETSVVLHMNLRLDIRDSANAGFWRWAALARFQDVIGWRFRSPDPLEVIHSDNYGLGAFWRNFLAKLWFRAALSRCDDGDDVYRLARRGGADFWESGVVRHRYSACQSLTRALVAFQYPREGVFRGVGYSPQTLGLGPIREVYKRLRRHHAAIAFETLNEARCGRMLAEIARDLR